MIDQNSLLRSYIENLMLKEIQKNYDVRILEVIGNGKRKYSEILNFLGSKDKPEEVSDAKMEKLMNKITEENNLSEENVFEIGETVKVIEGPFESFTGTVESKDADKNVLRISISIFGRSTIIDIEANRVEKI